MSKYKKHIYLFIFITMLIGITGFTILFINFRKQVKYQNEILRIENNLIQADSLTNNLLQIESQIRGFQLTSDVSYLKDFEKIKKSCSNNLVDLEKNTLFPNDRMIVAQIDTLSRNRIASLDSGSLLFTCLGASAALEYMDKKVMKETREKLNDQIRKLKNRFLQRLKESTDNINSRSDYNLTGLLILLSIFILMLLLAGRTFSQVQLRIIKSHNKFKEAQRIAKIGSWEWDIATNKVTWSEEEFRLFGQDRKKFKPTLEKYFNHLPEQGQQNVRSFIKNAIEGKSNYALEHEIIRGDGSTLMVYNQAKVVFDENQRPVRMIGTTQDISERKKVQKELMLAQKKYQAIFDNVTDGIYQSTMEGQFIMVNPAMAKMFGYRTPDEFISHMTNIGTQLYANADDRQRMSELLVRNDHVENFEVQLLTRNGEVLWVSESTRAVRNAKGAIIHFEGTLRNITQQKRAEAEMIEAKKKYQAIFDNTANGVYQSTPEGKFIMVNQSMARIFRYDSREELISVITDIGQHIYADPVEREKMTEIILAEGHLENYELRVLTKYHETIWVNANIRIIRNDEGGIHYYEGMLEDITERKKSEEKILLLNRSLDQFANITAHDLQEPIRMVSGFLGLLEKRYNNALDEMGKSYIFRAKDGAERMSILIKDLLEFSRSGNTSAKKEYVDLSHVIDLVVEDLSIVIADTGTKLRLQDSMPVVFGTHSALYRLLLNLVSNGIKFKKKDTLPVITITTNELSDCWEFAIQDNGIGVAEKDQPKLFQAFQRLHRKEEYPGTGLGLVTCKKIVETHGGKIWMNSEFGKGTTFYFTISKVQEATMAA